MKRKNEKGFALVLSLVLLMVMSLLGGSLIVITATDHQSNNSSDEYQQAFYVAETALLEGEKSVVNRMMGPWVNVEEEFVDVPTGMTEGEKEENEIIINDETLQRSLSDKRPTSLLLHERSLQFQTKSLHGRP